MSQRKPNPTTPINKAQIAYYTSTQTALRDAPSSQSTLLGAAAAEEIKKLESKYTEFLVSTQTALRDAPSSQSTLLGAAAAEEIKKLESKYTEFLVRKQTACRRG